MITSKLAIGSAQFGMDYGIANQIGRVNPKNVQDILNYANTHSISSIDTAQLYGDSEKVLGNFNLSNFAVGTKIPEIDFSIKNHAVLLIERSLKNLSVEILDYVLLHQPNQLLSNKSSLLYSQLEYAKKTKLCSKIGVSVYSPEELDQILERFEIDIVQLPFNILDGRWFDVIEKAKRFHIEIHARSIFLQGLLFMREKPSFFNSWKTVWSALDKQVLGSHMEVWEHALNYCLHKLEIDKVIVGVDSISQLRQIVQASRETYFQLDFEQITDSKLLNPMNWRI